MYGGNKSNGGKVAGECKEVTKKTCGIPTMPVSPIRTGDPFAGMKAKENLSKSK